MKCQAALGAATFQKRFSPRIQRMSYSSLESGSQRESEEALEKRFPYVPELNGSAKPKDAL